MSFQAELTSSPTFTNLDHTPTQCLRVTPRLKMSPLGYQAWRHVAGPDETYPNSGCRWIGETSLRAPWPAKPSASLQPANHFQVIPEAPETPTHPLGAKHLGQPQSTPGLGLLVPGLRGNVSRPQTAATNRSTWLSEVAACVSMAQALSHACPIHLMIHLIHYRDRTGIRHCVRHARCAWVTNPIDINAVTADRKTKHTKTWDRLSHLYQELSPPSAPSFGLLFTLSEVSIGDLWEGASTNAIIGAFHEPKACNTCTQLDTHVPQFPKTNFIGGLGCWYNDLRFSRVSA